MEVHTSKEVNAVNGTNLRLKCTFSSSSPISQHLSVTWNFQPEDLGSHELEPYNLPSGRFKERVTWDGNIERNDASIMIWNLQPTDNGTFTCQVKNPPDANGVVGNIRVVTGGKGEEMVFYYYSNHSIPVGRFRERVQWQGDISCWDGSIQLRDVQVNDSGTYVCEIRLLQRSSIFKNHTVLHVSPTEQRGVYPDAAALGNTGFWPLAVGCGCVAVVLAFLAGLSLRKRYQHWLWAYGAEQSTSLQTSCTVLPGQAPSSLLHAGLEQGESEGSSLGCCTACSGVQAPAAL
uniref:Uncharacterized protein n=1 Tax=Melopsittacus undulatus TaxID=13146 RepID=A0A8V5GZX9_MELUD